MHVNYGAMKVLQIVFMTAMVLEGAAESCNQLRREYENENFEVNCAGENNVCASNSFSLDNRAWTFGVCTSSQSVCDTFKAFTESQATCAENSCEVSCVPPVDGVCAGFQCSPASNLHAISAVSVTLALLGTMISAY